jgi:hypothetical protein
MRIKLFNQVHEELNLTKMSEAEFKITIDKIKKILEEYKFGILDNLQYNVKTNKVEYKDFENINVEDIVDQLNTEIGKDIVDQFNIETFLRKVHQILDLKRRNTIRKIKEEFENYYNSIEGRFSEETPDTKDEDHFDKAEGEFSLLPRRKYEEEKYDIQVELLKLQEWVVKNGQRVAIVFEGRDSAGKG